MKRIILMLFLTGPAALLFEGCFTECHCPKVATYFKADKIKSEVVDFYKNDSFFTIKDSGTIQPGNLAVKISTDFSYYGNSINIPSFSLFNTSIACKCVNNGYGGTTKKLKAVHVISNEAFNTNFITADTVTSIAIINGMSIDSYIKNYNLGIFIENNTFDFIQFIQLPKVSTWHSFSIVYQYDTYSLLTNTQHFIIYP